MVWNFRRNVFVVSVLLLLGDTGMLLPRSSMLLCDRKLVWGWIGAGTSKLYLMTWGEFSVAYAWSTFCVNIIMTLLIGRLLNCLPLFLTCVCNAPVCSHSWENMVGNQACRTSFKFSRPTCISHRRCHIASTVAASLSAFSTEISGFVAQKQRLYMPVVSSLP